VHIVLLYIYVSSLTAKCRAWNTFSAYVQTKAKSLVSEIKSY